MSFLSNLFKNKEAENKPSSAWKKKHGDEAVKKVSKYGYFAKPGVWVSETKEEWEAAVKKNPNGETYEGVKDNKQIRSK